jgi:hypothetical protein
MPLKKLRDRAFGSNGFKCSDHALKGHINILR